MTETFEQGRMFPKEAAEEISIAPATLRKYSQIVEEITGQEDYFQRNEQGTRTYSKKDIKMLSKMSELSAETKKPVRTIAEDLFKNHTISGNETTTDTEESETTALTTPENNEHQSTSELLNIIDQQNQKIEQQNQKIDHLVQLMNAFTTEMKQNFSEMKPMIEKSQHLIETSGEQNEKIQENLEKIQKETAELKEQQEAKAKKEEEEHKALGNSPFNTEATQNNTSSQQEPIVEEKVGFFQRLFGKK